MIYLVYIYEIKPHIETWFNVLELINQLLLALIIYSMTGFILSNGLLTSSQLWNLGYFVIVLIAIIYVINFTIMIWATFKGIKTYQAQRRHRIRQKRYLKERLDKGVEIPMKTDRQLDSHRNLTTMPIIDEESYVSSIMSIRETEPPAHLLALEPNQPIN